MATMRSFAVVIPLLLAACSGAPAVSRDVVGPYSGPIHRFVVDRITLPTTVAEAGRFANDLDGDGTADNELGAVISTLAGQGDGTTHGPDMIAAGVLASFVEIQADDLANDDTVGVRYLGIASADTPQLGGTLDGGTFRSNRTQLTVTSIESVLHLPVLGDADPIVATMIGTEIDLDPDGHGGFDGFVRGAVLAEEALDAAAPGLAQMIEANPRAHLTLAGIVDVNGDGQIAVDEIRHASFIESLLAPDVSMFDNGVFHPAPRLRPDAVSVGFGVHLEPCPDGNCALAMPANSCFDRVLDGDETALDCGGSCTRRCPAGATCTTANDCQTGACDSGHCRAPTCTDGIANGFEGDVDCGRGCATRCAIGQRCNADADCASNNCSLFTECKP
jgi:hypothetical protein